MDDDGTYTYSYDHNGNRQRRFDSSGNQVKYFWDHRNRLTRVDVRNSSGVTLERYTFEYDAYNRLVTKTVDSDANGTVNATYHWIYDGDQAVLQFDGNAAADLSHRYLWGPVVDQLLADETVDDGGTEDVLWAFTDWQGSVRHLASYDESASVTSIENHKFYDAFGNVASETNSAVDTVFGYTGRMWDDDLDLQNNLNRWYDPEAGRWLTEDPADFGAGDPNLYRYVGNSPGDSVDPWGLEKVVEGPYIKYGPLTVRHLYEQDGTWIGMEDGTGVVYRPGRGTGGSPAGKDAELWMKRLSNQSYMTSRAEVDKAVQQWWNPDWSKWFPVEHDPELEYGSGVQARVKVVEQYLGSADFGVRSPETYASDWDNSIYATEKGIKEVRNAWVLAPLGASTSRSGPASSYRSNTAAQLQAEKNVSRASKCWKSIGATQPLYEGTAIPRSFELTTHSGARVWVHVPDRIAIVLLTELWLYRFGGRKRVCTELSGILEKPMRAGPI